MIRPAPIRLAARPELSPRLLRARVTCLQAQAHKDPAALAWRDVIDAFFACVSEVPPARAT